MKTFFLTVLVAISLTACASDNQLPRYRFSNFASTPIWELANAVQDDDANKVRELLSTKKIDINYKDPKYYQTLLALAIANHKEKTIVELLKGGADPNQLLGEDKDATPLSTAINTNENCNLYYIETLLKFDANPNLEIKNPHNEYYFEDSFPLIAAINLNSDNGEECINIIKLLVENGADINCCYRQPDSDICAGVLSEAIIARSVQALRYFVIEKNIKVPDTVIIYGEVNKSTQKAFGLKEVLLSEHFVFKDFDNEYGRYNFQKQREIISEILIFLDRKE